LKDTFASPNPLLAAKGKRQNNKIKKQGQVMTTLPSLLNLEQQPHILPEQAVP
jgi:hypothetical protein